MAIIKAWPDLSPYGAKLQIIRNVDARGKRISDFLLVNTGTRDPAKIAEIERCIAELDKGLEEKFSTSGMRRLNTPRPMWVKPDAVKSFQDIFGKSDIGRKAFPLARAVSIDDSEIIVERTVGENTAEHSAAVEATQRVRLGLNHLGQEVYSDANGRFVVDGEIEIREAGRKAGMSPAVFLRAIGREALSFCADAFVADALDRRLHLRPDDLSGFAERILEPAPRSAQKRKDGPDEAQNPETREITDDLIRDVEVAVRLALARYAAKKLPGLDNQAFDDAIRMSEGIENAFTRWRGISLPVAVAAQRLLADELDPSAPESSMLVAPDRVGAVVAALPNGFRLRPVAIESADADVVNSVMRTRGLVKESSNEKPALALTALPAIALENPVTEMGIEANRRDHEAMLKALMSRSPKGRSVHILAEGSEDQIKILSEISKDFEVEAIADVDAGIFSGPPGQFGGQIVVVGRRRGTPKETGSLPEILTIAGHDELREWTERTIATRIARDAGADETTAAAAGSAAAAVIASTRKENNHQAVYVPASKSGQASSMVPRNMQGAHNLALTRLRKWVQREHGGISVDTFVAQQLRWTEEQLGQRLAPEQIDAVALGIYAMSKGRAFVEGDQTGLGKGRVLAALALWSALNGVPTHFITEKSGLFNDFWRDIKDIDADRILTPLIINAGVKIREGGNSEILHSAPDKDTIDEFMMTGEIPPEYNVVLSTYTQFNRALASSPKAAWLRTAAQGALVILDEAHNAAGNSNVSDNIKAAITRGVAANVVFSSATFAKNHKNFHLYERVFRESMPDLEETLKKGRAPLMETMSTMLVEDGVMVRREHDLSDLTIETKIDEENRPRNKRAVDLFAPVLQQMALLGGDIDRAIGAQRREVRDAIQAAIAEQGALAARVEQNGDDAGARRALAGARQRVARARDAAKMNGSLSGSNFGSRLFSMNKLFHTLLKLDFAAQEAIDSLNRGEKPVIVMESTLESALKDAMDIDDLAEGEQVKAPRLRDLVRKNLDKMVGVNAETTPEQAFAERPAMMQIYELCLQSIERLPDLSGSPIDVLKTMISAAGGEIPYNVEEISGRSLKESGGYIEKLQKRTKEAAIAEFNSGEIDCLILTRSGSTGISLHASHLFNDKRPRHLIELETVLTPTERVQFWGRVNRRGQVISPRITTLSLGLAGSMRLEAMQNQKLADLSANVQASQEHAAMAVNTPNFLNSIGNEVASRYFEAYPHVRERLGIDPPIDQADQDRRMSDNFYIEMLSSRISMLGSYGDEVLDELLEEYKSVMDDYEAAGMSPLKTSELKGQWKINGRALFEGTMRKDLASVFDAPVFLSDIEGWRYIQPMKADEIRIHVDDGLRAWGESPPKDAADRLKRGMEVVLRQSLPREYASVEEALAAPGDNPAKTRKVQLDRLIEIAESLKPGASITMQGAFGQLFTGIVTNVVVPPRGNEHHIGRWRVEIAFPGEETPMRMTMHRVLSKIVNLPGAGLEGDRAEEILERFDMRFSGRMRFRERILEGNVFKAAQMAALQGLGTPVIYQHEWLGRQRGIKIRRDRADHIMRAPVRFSQAGMVADWIRMGRAAFADGKLKTEKGPSLYWLSRNMVAHENNAAQRKEAAQAERRAAGRRGGPKLDGGFAVTGSRFADDDKLVLRLPPEKGNEDFYNHPRVVAMLDALEAEAVNKRPQRERRAVRDVDGDDLGQGARLKLRRKPVLVIDPEMLNQVCEVLYAANNALYAPGEARPFLNKWLEENVAVDPAAEDINGHGDDEHGHNLVDIADLDNEEVAGDDLMNGLFAVMDTDEAKPNPGAEAELERGEDLDEDAPAP
jgi:hypothetical protein